MLGWLRDGRTGSNERHDPAYGHRFALLYQNLL
jgi:hypothetical protein